MRARTMFVALFFSFGFAAQANNGPDLGKVLRVVTRFGIAHACPIAENMVITNAHVVDLKPFDPRSGLFGGRFASIDEKTRGMMIPRLASASEDLAIGVVTTKVEYYPIATKQPEVDEQLWWAGYDYSKSKKMMRTDTVSGRVVTVFAGNIIINADSMPGSSGSCVLNNRSEVVGIVAWGSEPASGNEVTIVVGVYGKWLRPIDELKKAIGLEESEK